MQLDAKALADATAEIVKGHVAAATAPLLKRIEVLEARPSPERGEKGERGERGDIGVGLAGALIDRSGVLILTLSDGTTRELGAVVGKDGAQGPQGEKGEQGERGEPGERGEQGEIGPAGEKGTDGRDGVDGKDGRDGPNGRDGVDGFGFDDLTVEQRDERIFGLKFVKDDRVKDFEFRMPILIDRGVFKQGTTYAAGDAVTWGGSLWIAQRETDAKPDTQDSGWRLAVKRGRDGKDAPPK